MLGFVKGLGERALGMAGLPLRWAGAQLEQGRRSVRTGVSEDTLRHIRAAFGLGGKENVSVQLPEGEGTALRCLYTGCDHP